MTFTNRCYHCLANTHAPRRLNAKMQQIHRSFLKSECPVTHLFLQWVLSTTGQHKDIFGLWAPSLLRENESAKRDGFRSHVVVTRLKCWRLLCPSADTRQNQHITLLANQGKRFFAIGINLTKGFTGFKGWVFSNYTNRGTFSLYSWCIRFN